MESMGRDRAGVGLYQPLLCRFRQNTGPIFWYGVKSNSRRVQISVSRKTRFAQVQGVPVMGGAPMGRRAGSVHFVVSVRSYRGASGMDVTLPCGLGRSTVAPLCIQVRTLRGHEHAAYHACFTRDGRYVLP